MTIEEFRAKKQKILNSTTAQKNNKKISMDEFRKKKQQILSGLQEQAQSKETVSEKLSSPQTIQQKMDNLWEEEKQTMASNTTSIQKGKTGLPWTMEARMNNVMSKPISEESIKHIKETSPILNPEKYHKETDAGYYGGRAVEGLFGATEGVLDALAIAGKHIMAPQMKKAEEITSFNGALPNPISKGFGNLEETYRVTLPEKAMQENPTQIFSDSLNFKYNNTNKAERLVGDVVSGATSMVPTIGANLAVPGLGYAVLGAQGFGGGTQQAYQKTGELGAGEELYGLLSGLAEVGVEKISGGIGGLGNGAVDKIASKMIKNGFIRNATGEGIEEAVTTFIDPYLQRLTYDKEATGGITDIETWKEALRNALIGTLTSMILQAPSSVSDTTRLIKSNINSNADTKKLNDIDSITQSQLAEINNNISQGETIDIKNKNTEEIKSELDKLVPMQKNDASQLSQTELNNSSNQVIPVEAKAAQNGNMEQINDARRNNIVNRINSNQYLGQQEKNELISMVNTNNITSEMEKEVNNILNTINSEFGLKNITNDFNANKANYVRYMNDKTNIDSSYIENAKKSVKTKDDRRTKEQWLSVAKKLGSQIYEMSDSEVERYAYKTWIENKPNSVRNLNRQGKKYVKFGLDEWVNSVYNSVREARNRTTQTTQNDKIMDALIGKKSGSANNVAKNEVFSYTNDRGDINGKLQFEGILGNDIKPSGVYEENQPKQAQKYTRAEYERFEKSIRPVAEGRITEQERELAKQYKDKYNKEIIIFDEKENNGFIGGASLVDKSKIYIDINSANEFGYNMIASHEVMESDILHNQEVKKDIIDNIVQKIMDDPNFEKQKIEFWRGQEGELPPDYLIAKDIICDRFAELDNNEALSYNNVLSQETNMTLDYGITSFREEINNKNTQADEQSAFSMPENTDISQLASSEAPRPYMDFNMHISNDKDSKITKVSLTDIQNAINDIVTVKTGKFRQQAYGIYKNQGEIIRLKQTKDIPVALHELTHHLDKKYNLSSSDKAFSELENIAVVGKNATKQTVIKEGVAEFGRYYMTNKEYAKEIAPFYYDAFETALDSDPVMKGKVEAIRQMVSDYLDQSPLNRFLSNIDKGDNEVSLWDDVKNKLIEAKKSFRKNFVDDLDPLKKIIEEITNSKELESNKDAHKLLRLNKGVTGRVRVALEYGIVDNNGNKIGKGLKEIIEPVADDIDGFIAYISALRASDLEGRGIESGFNKKDIDEVLKMYKENKTFENASKELYQFQNQILEKTLIESGIITKEALESYNKNNPHYVPFYRVMDENFKQSKDSMSKAPKKIKGSTRDIINPLESIIKNVYSYMQLAEKNNAYKALFNLASEYDGTGKWFDKVPTDMVGTKITANDVKDILEQLNLDKEDVDYNEIFTTMFKPSYNQKGNIITVMENGKPAHYEINDKELYDILAPANTNKKENMLLTLMNKGATALRVGATHSPEFIFRNPIRDTLDAGIYSKNGFVPFVDTISGIFEIIGRSDLYYKWLESGGSGSTYTNAQRKALRNTLQELIPQVADNKSNVNKVVDILVNTAKHPLKTYLDVAGNISNIMEEGTRVGEFKKALNKTENLKESALESRSITVDFSRGGTQSKELNKYIAFLNAEIQGLDKMFSSFSERPVATALKGFAYLTIPSIIIRALQDDDEMDKVPQWEKDTYWVFFIGDTPVKIPKPQGLGQLFATLPERAIDFIKTQDKEAFDGLLQRLMTSYMPIDSSTSLLPTAWQPLIENATNYSFFRQQPIVKQSLQNRSPKYQYDENTSTIAKTVGGALNVSPKKIDNLISGYGGNLGKDIANIAGVPIDMVNMLVNGGKKEKEYSTFNSTLRKIPLIKGFVASDTASKELDNFYEEKSKINTLYTDMKFKYSGKELNSKQKKELEDVQSLNKIYNSAYNDIKELNEQINEIEKSNRTNKYKENSIEKIEEEIDKIAKETEKRTKTLKESILSYK